ncbi:hypothetical protein JXA84_06405 [candidate division WOR-3 bacterium]|nr:hypothetical protein [candidate division WOR-3 bacterium]
MNIKNPKQIYDLEKYFYDFKGQYTITESQELTLDEANELLSKITERIAGQLPEERQYSTEIGYAVIDRFEETEEYFLAVTFLSELAEEKPVSNCSKLLILKKSSEPQESQDETGDLLPFAEMFAGFFNLWGVKRQSIFPFIPDKFFFEYDFETFDFFLVKFVSPVKISKMQSYYSANDYILLSGEFADFEKYSGSENVAGKKIAKLLENKNRVKIKISELVRLTGEGEETLSSAFMFLASDHKIIENKGKTFFGSSAIVVVTGEYATIYSPSYFLTK